MISKYLNLDSKYNTTFSHEKSDDEKKKDMIKANEDHLKYMNESEIRRREVQKLEKTVIRCPLCTYAAKNKGGFDFECIRGHQFSIN